MTKRNEKEYIDRLVAAMDRFHVDVMLLTSPDSVFYCSGFASNVPYQTQKIGVSNCVVTREGKVYVCCTQFERQNAMSSIDPAYVTVLSFPTWVYIEDFAVEGEEKEEQFDAMKIYEMACEVMPKGKGTVLGVEPNVMPYLPYQYLCGIFGEENIVDCAPVLREARRIKTEYEIDLLRRAAQCTELAASMTARQTVPGMTEGDVMRLYRMNSFNMTSDVVNVNCFHTVGPDFAPAYISRSTRIASGDVVRLDGGVKLLGYNADVGRTFAVGKTTAGRERIYETLYGALAKGAALIGPGVRMCDVYDVMLNHIREHGIPAYIRGHHGHSIGCAMDPEEAPFISPGETRVFEPGMVFCVEAPYYSSRNHSFIVEDTFLVTENGAEFFTRTPPTLYI